MKNNRLCGKIFAFQQRIGLTLLDIAAILLCLTALRLADDMYQGSGDWIRTLGRNYDFSGENRNVHTLYIGQLRAMDVTGENEDFGTAENLTAKYAPDDASGDVPDGVSDAVCDLRCQGQTLVDSYYLLLRADRRYVLSEVYLTLESGEIETSAETEAEWDREASYMRKILEYCHRKGIVVFINGVPAAKDPDA